MTEKSSTIEVAARDLIQLFNSLDPSPFPERDLDDEAEAFIVSWAKDFTNRPLSHRYSSSDARINQGRAARTPEGVFKLFRLSLGNARPLRARGSSHGRRFLVVGILVLALCNMLAHILIVLTHSSPFAQLAADGLVIFGWVANWRPAEIFLYDFWEMRRTRLLYRRLADAEIALVPRKEETPEV